MGDLTQLKFIAPDSVQQALVFVLLPRIWAAALSQKARKKLRKVSVVMLDMRGGLGAWRDMDRAHAKRVGHLQIARVILEHRGTGEIGRAHV